MTAQLDNLRQVFRPRAKMILLYLFLSMIVLLFGNLDVLSSEFPEVSFVIRESLNYQLELLGQSAIFNNIILILFWGGVALVVNVLIWAVINVGIEARNEAVMELEYVNQGSLLGRLKAPAIQIGLGLVLLSVLLAAFLYILPFLLGQFRHFLMLSPAPWAFGMLLVILAASVAIAHLVASLTKAVFLVN